MKALLGYTQINMFLPVTKLNISEKINQSTQSKTQPVTQPATQAAAQPAAKPATQPTNQGRPRDPTDLIKQIIEQPKETIGPNWLFIYLLQLYNNKVSIYPAEAITHIKIVSSYVNTNMLSFIKLTEKSLNSNVSIYDKIILYNFGKMIIDFINDPFLSNLVINLMIKGNDPLDLDFGYEIKKMFDNNGSLISYPDDSVPHKYIMDIILPLDQLKPNYKYLQLLQLYNNKLALYPELIPNHITNLNIAIKKDFNLKRILPKPSSFDADLHHHINREIYSYVPYQLESLNVLECINDFVRSGYLKTEGYHARMLERFNTYAILLFIIYCIFLVFIYKQGHHDGLKRIYYHFKQSTT
jgi:hypothetical protein